MKKEFHLKRLPVSISVDGELLRLISEANRAIGKFNGLLQNVKNKKLFIAPLIRKEAVVSSQIEGTQATLEDVLEYEALQIEKGDVKEVYNYVRAIDHAVKRMEEGFPLSLRLIKEIHGILLEGVRGKNKDPGEFRKVQNWIGAPGSKIEEATYIPPPPQEVMDYMGNLEKYFYYEDEEPLIQTAIIHAQFELIHPFLDGNGRVGRLLIPLFLFHRKVIDYPSFYISEYWLKHRNEYYQALLSISEKDSFEDWVKFFLKSVIAQAGINTERVEKIMRLYEEVKDIVPHNTPVKLLDFIFNYPTFTTKKLMSSVDLNISQRAYYRYLEKLVELGILKVESQGRGKLYKFEELLKLLSIGNY